MNTEKVLKESKIIMTATLLLGIVLLACGILFRYFDVKLISNNRAIIALSFMPFAISGLYYYKILQIRKHPQKMKNTIINESDERLTSLRNKADAVTFKLLKGLIFMTYMGYTFIVPKDIFTSAGWWILLVIFFTAFTAQGIIYEYFSRKDNKDN